MTDTFQLYVKNTSNCTGLPLQTFERLGPEWRGDSIEIPFVNPGGDDEIGDGDDDFLVMCEVTGWTDLFGGRPCPVHVAWVRRLPQPTPAAEELMGWPDWQSTTGILIWGGNSGIRVTDPGAYEEGIGIGMPFMWLEDPALLPEDVRAAIRPTDHPELPT